MSNWVVTWNACFGALSGNRADAMEVYISDKLEGLKTGELDKAIEQMASDPMGKAPSIPSLISLIREMRKRARGINVDEPYDVTQARRQIAQMPLEGLERWDLICKVHEDHRGFFTSNVITEAINHGGLTIPWWANPHRVRHTRQEQKPPGVKGMVDLLGKAKKTMQYTHDDEQ